MKNRGKKHILTLLAAVMLCMAAFPLTAYAGGGEEAPEEVPTETAVPAPEPKPFTPAGTGTVVDNATDEDGKEFYTIMTPSENVFYLVIDRQRETENVYFLNAVTEQDLMALAEAGGGTAQNGGSAIPEPAPAPEPTPEPEPVPEPEKGGGMGMVLVVALIVLIGGGAAYYFKIYRPKQEQASMHEDDDEYGEYEGEESEDNTPPWYEDEGENGDSL